MTIYIYDRTKKTPEDNNMKCPKCDNEAFFVFKENLICISCETIIKRELSNEMLLIENFIKSIKKSESAIETITEKGTEYTGQYIPAESFYDIIKEWQKQLGLLRIQQLAAINLPSIDLSPSKETIESKRSLYSEEIEKLKGKIEVHTEWIAKFKKLFERFFTESANLGGGDYLPESFYRELLTEVGDKKDDS